MSEDEFYENLKYIIDKYIDKPEICFDKITNLKYPNTNKYISLEHARIYYETYAKYSLKVDLDKNFDANAYAKNKKIRDNANKEYKPSK